MAYYELDALLSNTTPSTAKSAIDNVVNTCADYGLNTIFFHVRGNSDAYYRSTVYPTAKSVVSLLKQGFDPLAYAIEAAHKKGLKLHAWINPYRVGKGDKAAEDTFAYDGTLYYRPHDKGVQETILQGVAEVVEKYEVDGVQFDDYFYPVGAVPEDKPAAFEKEAYAAHQKELGDKALSIGDWRRSAVDGLIEDVYRAVHKRSDCVFGISPAGDAKRVRERMYADVLSWINRTDRVDYICPQIYFGFDHETYPFHRTVKEWISYPRAESVKLCIGLSLYKVGQKDDYAGTGATEWQTHNTILARQVNWLRTEESIDGFSLFSYGWLQPDTKDLSADALKTAKKELTALKEAL